jgi:hypothetical protein
LINFGALNNEAAFVKKALRKFGLVDDFSKAIGVMGRMVRDHKHFETLITEAPPELRQELYDSLRPHLRFAAKPLDVYIADAQQRAERERLPVLGEDGLLHEFSPARDVSTTVKDAQEAIDRAAAKRVLTLVCAKCTREQSFYQMDGETAVDTIIKGRKAGWIYDYKADPPVEICPDCPTSLRTVN